MSQRVNLDGLIYEIKEGRMKRNGQILSIRCGKTKENGVVKTIVLAEELPEVMFVSVDIVGIGNSTYSYFIMNYTDGKSRKFFEPTTNSFGYTESIDFHCYGKTAEIILDGITVAQGEYGGVDYTWIPTASEILVEFETTVTSTTSRKIKITTQ